MIYSWSLVLFMIIAYDVLFGRRDTAIIHVLLA